MSLSDCNGRQLNAIVHITNRKNTRHRGPILGIDRDAVVGSGRHSYLVEPERSDVRRAAHSEHKRIGHKMISVAEFHGDAAVDVPLGAHQRRAEEELDPARRSEEHTSELQSLMRTSYADFCLKKKTTHQTNPKNFKTNT